MRTMTSVLLQDTGRCLKVRRRLDRKGNICITAVLWFLVSYGITVPHTALGASWEAVCTNVPNHPCHRDLWFDSPGASAPRENNEAGFFWLKTDQSADEKCTYHTFTRAPVVPISYQLRYFRPFGCG